MCISIKCWPFSHKNEFYLRSNINAEQKENRVESGDDNGLDLSWFHSCSNLFNFFVHGTKPALDLSSLETLSADLVGLMVCP